MKPAVIRRSPQLAFMTMNVLTEADTPDTKPDKGLIFLYRLVPGASWPMVVLVHFLLIYSCQR